MTARLDSDGLAELLAEGEGRRLEFKEGFSNPEKLARTLAAFANTRGGVLVIGVDDAGRVRGVPRPDEVRRELAAAARDAVDPPLELEPRTLELDGKRVVVATIELSKRRPHAVLHASGEREIVVRVGASNRRAEGAAKRALELDRRHAGGLAPLEKNILAWIGALTPKGDGAASRADVASFAKARNVGVQRARRAFIALERRGLIVGYGSGSRRAYALP
ncbi:MAG: ATP-binding protein [Planctomycetes bacterium]|nr:ATP-binding protein [Planctomycetota bacterium]